MEKDDFYTGVGTAISTVFAAISWLWDIPFLQFFCTFTLGSFVTYLIQTRLQNRSEKRKITREKIEKIYGPLYVELQNIKDGLMNKIENLASPRFVVNGEVHVPLFEKIKTFPEYFSIPLQLRKDMDFIDDHVKNIDKSLWDVRRKVESHIVKLGNVIFKEHINQEWDRLSDDQIGYFGIRYNSEMNSMLYYGSIWNQIMLNKDPIKDLKQLFPDFNPTRCSVDIMVERDNPPSSPSSKRISIPLIQVEEEIINFLELTKKAIKEEKDVRKFLELRRELSEKIDTLLPSIRKHIEKHYPIEKI